MKNLKNRIEVLEEQLEKKEQKRQQDVKHRKVVEEAKKISVEKLPYSYSALKQFIDPETMNIHYNKHYKGYVDKLNAALGEKDHGDLSLEEIVKTIERFNKFIRNQAGGAFNHQLFWKMLSPKPMTPKGLILKMINRDFGSFAGFKKKFDAQSKDRFGSGWCWLVLTKRGTLKIMSTPNQDNPLMDVVEQGGYPLLGLDLWEHAYYLRYRNRREEYIKNFWKVVNWDYVEDALKQQLDKSLKESESAKEFLTEGAKSEPCSSADRMASKVFFNQNRDALNIYKNAIMQILKEVFPERYYGRDEYQPGTMSGIYNLEGDGRSIINYLNTNYSAFCVLKKDLNKYLEKINKPLIDFTDKNPKEQVAEMVRMLKVLNHVKFRVFNPESETLKTMMSVMGASSKKGNQTEDAVVEKLKKQFGDDNVSRIGELGSKEDMLNGVDVKITIDGKEHTAQVKPFSHITKTDSDMYKVDGTANVKRYQTDWMIFMKNLGDMVIFDNKNSKIFNGVYFFPIDAKLYQL
jgi:Fe-Mn family superoxide dismutase